MEFQDLSIFSKIPPECQEALAGSNELFPSVQQSLVQDNVVDAAKNWQKELAKLQLPGEVIPITLADRLQDILVFRNKTLNSLLDELPIRGISGSGSSPNPWDTYVCLFASFVAFFDERSATEALAFPSGSGIASEIGGARRHSLRERLEKTAEIQINCSNLDPGIDSLGWKDLFRVIEGYRSGPMITLAIDQAILDRETLEQLADVVEKGARVSTIRLSHCSLEVEGLAKLAEAIRKNDNLMRLDLNHSPLRDQDFAQLAPWVEEGQPRELIVTGCGVNPEVWQPINDRCLYNFIFSSVTG